MPSGPRGTRTQWGLLALRIAVVAAAYIVGARLGLRLALDNRNVTPVWPPTGIAVAALSVWGLRTWPGVAIGAVAANVLNGAGLQASVAIAVGNTLAPVVGVAIIRRLGFDRSLARVRDALLLVFVGGTLAMTISASLGTATLIATDAIGTTPMSTVWLLWWVGDAIGVMLFAPILLVLAHPPLWRQVRARPYEAAAVFLFSVACAVGVFGAPILIPYFAFVPVVWAALRFEQPGAAVTTAMISVIAVVVSAAGRGPFADATPGLVSLQTFNASIALTALLLAAVRTERRTALEALQASEHLYRRLFEQADDIVCIHDAAGRITYVNPSAERLTGYPSERLRSMTIGELVAPEFGQVVLCMTERQLEEPDAPLTYEVEVVATGGRRVALEVSSTVVHDAEHVAGVQLIGRDVTMRRVAEDQLRHRVLHDDLTGLPNEALFRERVDYALARAEADATGLAVLLVDVDGFGEINRRIGSVRGDALLRTIAIELGKRLRPTDGIARLRWDEFCVLLAPVDGVDDAVIAAKQMIDDTAEALASVAEEGEADAAGKGRFDDLREVIERMRSHDDEDEDHRPSASVGIATFPGRARDGASLVRQADLAMHAARQSGGGTHAVYGPRHDPGAVRQHVLEDDFPEAIDQRQLVASFQPKIDLRTLATVGVDCSPVWQHPRHGEISSDELARLSEGAARTAELTSWTIREALRRSRIWAASGAGAELPIAVHVPSSELVRATFVNELRALVDRSSVAPNRLLVMVSERDVMDASVHNVIARLRDMGVGLAVTGFGTGYSSMVQLRRLPITELRIDPSFVVRLVASPEDRAIATSIVELAHTIGVPAVAAGLETRETWSHLLDIGFDLAMGPLVGGSMTSDELEAWMRTPGWSTRVG